MALIKSQKFKEEKGKHNTVIFEIICIGSLAGHNAVRLIMGMPLLILPSSIAIGNLISLRECKSYVFILLIRMKLVIGLRRLIWIIYLTKN